MYETISIKNKYQTVYLTYLVIISLFSRFFYLSSNAVLNRIKLNRVKRGASENKILNFSIIIISFVYESC